MDNKEHKQYYIPENLTPEIVKKAKNFRDIAIIGSLELLVLYLIPFTMKYFIIFSVIIVGFTGLILYFVFNRESAGTILLNILKYHFVDKKKYRIRRIGEDGYGRTKEVIEATKRREEELKEYYKESTKKRKNSSKAEKRKVKKGGEVEKGKQSRKERKNSKENVLKF